MLKRFRHAGQSIMEIVITVGVFAVLASGVILLVADPLASGVHGAQRDMAANLVQQGVEGARAIKDSSWTNLTLGTHGVTRDGSGNWLFSGVTDTTVVGGVTYTRAATVTTACRNLGGALVAVCGTIDPHTMLVTVLVSWTSGVTAIPRTVSQAIYFSDWESYSWTQTTDTDFNGGSTNNTMVSGTGTAGTLTLSTSSKWSAVGGAANTLIHTTDTDWNSGTYGSTASSGSGVPADMSEVGTSNWTSYTQSLNWAETTDTDFNDGTFATSTSAVADTGNLGAVVLNTLTDSATMTSPITFQLNSVSCWSSSNCWAVGNNGVNNTLARIIKWDGVSWTNVNTPPWAAGTAGWGLNGVAVTSATEAFAVGDLQDSAGSIMQYFNGNWITSASTTQTNQNFLAISMLNPSFGWASTDSGIFMKWNGAKWAPWQADTGAHLFTSLYTNSATDAWAVTSGGNAQDGQFWHFNGTVWSQFFNDKGNGIDLTGVSCVNPSLCWAVANGGQIYKYNGVQSNSGWVLYQTLAGAPNLDEITMLSSTFGFTTGAGGTIASFNGTTWTLLTAANGGMSSLQPIGGIELFGAAVISTTKAYFVGTTGTIVEYGQHYYQDGVYYSNVFDAGSSLPWSSMQWDQFGITQQNGITLTLATRSGPITCSGATSCAGWSAWSIPETATTATSDVLTRPNNRYFQYRVTMRSQVRSATPRLNSINIAYNVAPAQDNYDLTMLSSTDGWGVGAGGGIVRWDGVGWSNYSPSPATAGLYGIGGVATNDLWATGLTGNVLHWNGTAWSLTSSGALTDWFIDVECLTSSNCRYVGGNFAASPYAPYIRRWNGSVWTDESPAVTGWLETIRYVTASDVWSSGSAGRVFHYNGTSWSLFGTYGTTTWQGMWINSATDGWIVGQDGANPGTGAARHWDGSAWNAVTLPGGTTGLQDVECVTSSLCWAVGNAGVMLKWNGVSWATDASSGVLTTQDIESVAVDGPNHAWAVAHSTGFLEYRTLYPATATWTSPIVDGGAVGTVWNSLQWDDVLPATTNITIQTRTGPNPTCCTGWSSYSTALTNPGGSAITSPANRYFQYQVNFSSGNLINTGTLQEVRMIKDAITAQPIYGIDGTAVADVWAVADSGVILHYNGTTWSTVTSPTSDTIRDVSALTATNAQAVGAVGQIMKWNGATWSLLTSPTAEDLYAVTLRTASDGWAVGTNGAIVRWNGVSWTSATTTPTASALYGVSMISATDGLGVGAGGVGIRWNGTSWSTVATGTSNTLNAVNCLDATHCWAVGDSGTIRFWNGAAWSGVTSPVVSRLNAVEWRNATEAWGIGDFGAIIKYDGASWTSYTSPTTANLYDLTVFAGTDGWLCGAGGQIEKDPATYQPVGIFQSSILDMDAATSTPLTAFWDATVPALTTVKVTGRVGNVAVPDGTWTGYAPVFTSSTGTALSLGTARYFQYKVTLSTSDTSITPTFDDITVTYR